MKRLLVPLLLSPLALSNDTVGSLPNASAGPPPGDKGVSDDSCWTDNDGHRVSVDIKGTLHGDQDVKLTEGDKSGSGKGTPASDDGCRESGQIQVGGEWYQIKKGKLQHRTDPNDQNSYKNMKQTKDDACADEEELPY